MLFWCAFLFVLGVAAFMDTLFNYGEIFRKINSVLFLLISLGLLIRTTSKMKAGKMESYERRVDDLEKKVTELSRPRERTMY